MLSVVTVLLCHLVRDVFYIAFLVFQRTNRIESSVKNCLQTRFF